MRAIGIFAGPIRLWGKLRRRQCAEWERKCDEVFFAAGEGRTALAPVWRAAARAEYRRGQWHEQQPPDGSRECAAGVFHDLEAFYDSIQPEALRAAAARWQFPKAMLEVGLKLYAGPRHLATGASGTATLYAGRGVMPGCSLCTTLAKLILLSAILEVRREWPALNLTLFVDDIGMTAQGNQQEVVDVLSCTSGGLQIRGQ